MGIKGLKTLLDSTKYKRAWSEDPIKDNLVIDGNNLCHELYSYAPPGHPEQSLDWLNGGQYPEYHYKVSNFFKTLCGRSIHLHVVFDGVAKESTLNDTVIKEKIKQQDLRCQKELKEKGFENTTDVFLPHLAYTVFFNVLRELKDQDLQVSLHVAKGEGDELCAKLANDHKCPVLSSDTDFMLFRLLKGCTTLKHLNWENSEAQVTATCVTQDGLVNAGFVPQNDMLFLIPAIEGYKADSSSLASDILKGYYPKMEGRKLLESVCSEISKFESVDSYKASITDEELQKKLQSRYDKVKTYYCACTTTTADLSDLTTSLHVKCPQAGLPDWFVERYQECRIPHFLVDAKVNKKQHHSRSLVSRHIRQCCYKILDVQNVCEYQNEGSRGEELSAMVECPNLHEIADKPEQCVTLLFTLLNITCKSTLDELNKVEEEDKLFLASVIFWKKTNVKLPEYVLKALLADYLLCSAGLEVVHSAHSCQRITRLYRLLDRWNVDRQHFLDWQSVYQDTMALNSLLMCPLQEKCPSKIYDGKIAMYLTSKSQSIDKEISKLRISEDKYHQFVKILTSS